jgi:hypothetical protein
LLVCLFYFKRIRRALADCINLEASVQLVGHMLPAFLGCNKLPDTLLGVLDELLE